MTSENYLANENASKNLIIEILSIDNQRVCVILNYTFGISKLRREPSKDSYRISQYIYYFMFISLIK